MPIIEGTPGHGPLDAPAGEHVHACVAEAPASQPTSVSAPAGDGWVDAKPVVLIGGAPGTGKSTLARDLSARLQFDHRIGTGFIRAALETETSPDVDPELFSRTFEADDPAAHLEVQARRLLRAITACVARARREGTSLIVEGSHLIPSLYSHADHDLYVVLTAPPPTRHLSRLTGATHTRRRISERDWGNVQRIEAYYRAEARRYDTPALVYEDLQPILGMLEGPGQSSASRAC